VTDDIYLQQLHKLPGQRILVLGDLMLDQWMWGHVSRISPEAPVPVVDVNRTTYTPGGAANVVCNLLTLGCRVTVAGLVGSDETGTRLRQLLEQHGAQTLGLVKSAARRTTVKTRIIAHSQQVVRVDQEEREPFSADEAAPLVHWLENEAEEFDGIFLSDYDKGLFTCPEIATYLPQLYRGGAPVVAGPKPENLSVFRGVQCLTLNAAEAAAATGLPVSDKKSTEAAGRELLRLSQAETVLVTRGENGMILFSADEPPASEPAFATEVYDVSGAGDTVLSVVGLGLCAGIPRATSIRLASHAAAVVVRKLGTATLTVEEIAQSLRQRGQ
jgi:D-beta-D-heptose 7-phosphate kinase / D-beta-D-heptose 1-phosphate adenosyltransferase